jgi:hypothetical protein
MLRTEPIDLKLHTTAHDLVFENGDVALTYSSEGIAQECKIAAKMIAGEWFYNLDEGIALYKREGIDPARVILGAKFSKPRVIAEFNRVLLAIEGVNKVNAIDVAFNSSTRTLSVKYEVTTIFGDTVADSLTFGG